MTASRQSRRSFLKAAAAGAAACALPGSLAARTLSFPELREAMFYEPLGNGSVRCGLCPWRCVVPDGKRGKCGVRENRGGKYCSLVYGYPVAIHNDPIEKKPFMHVYPGSRAFSIATVGCNLDCKFCQNWDISQAGPEQVAAPFRGPEEIARMAAAAGARTVAYTYSEPTIFYEYMHDCAAAARAAGIGNVVVSNGFINEEPLKKLLPLLTAMKVDLKSFSPEFYTDVCGGRLEPVLSTLKTVAGAGVWLEIVVLLIPTLNDSPDEIRRMAGWIHAELGPSVPVHFIPFHPQYKMRHLPVTPQAVMDRAAETALSQGLNFVYASGVSTVTTRCPECRAPLVDRVKYAVLKDSVVDARCPRCGAAIPGVWN